VVSFAPDYDDYVVTEEVTLTRIIALANQKGGAGKTTCAVNLACGWARLAGPDKRVLLIDADPQANATAVLMSIEFAAGPRQVGVDVLYEVLLKKAAADDAIQTLELSPSGDYAGAQLDILPAHLQLTVLERKLFGEFQAENRLMTSLQPIMQNYEAIIIDCPPSLGLLTLNALMVAHEVIIPVDPGLFPLIGLELLTETIEMVRDANPELHIAGVVPVMTDRTVLSRDTKKQLDASFGDLVLPEIPRRVAIGEAHTRGGDVFSFEPAGDGSGAYLKMVQEVMSRG